MDQGGVPPDRDRDRGVDEAAREAERVLGVKPMPTQEPLVRNLARMRRQVRWPASEIRWCCSSLRDRSTYFRVSSSCSTAVAPMIGMDASPATRLTQLIAT